MMSCDALSIRRSVDESMSGHARHPFQESRLVSLVYFLLGAGISHMNLRSSLQDFRKLF